MIRGSGIAYDLRKSMPYEVYADLTFDIPIGTNGDCYDRYLVRMEEMRQSLSIIKQCIDCMPEGPVYSTDKKLTPPCRTSMKQSMEATIHHFKQYSQGFDVPAGETYMATEAPKGEFGIFLVASDDRPNMPYRCRIRSPSFIHLQAMESMVKGHMLADLTTIIGSLDIVFGDVDR